MHYIASNSILKGGILLFGRSVSEVLSLRGHPVLVADTKQG